MNRNAGDSEIVINSANAPPGELPHWIVHVDACPSNVAMLLAAVYGDQCGPVNARQLPPTACDSEDQVEQLAHALLVIRDWLGLAPFGRIGPAIDLTRRIHLPQPEEETPW